MFLLPGENNQIFILIWRDFPRDRLGGKPRHASTVCKKKSSFFSLNQSSGTPGLPVEYSIRVIIIMIIV